MRNSARSRRKQGDGPITDKGAQVKRSRGRGRRPQSNNANRTFDSTGPEIKIRGSASHVYEKYLQLARDANSSGDRVLAENYLQHAEHYFRIMSAAQAQQQQAQAAAQQANDQQASEPQSGDQQPNGQRSNGKSGNGKATADAIASDTASDEDGQGSGASFSLTEGEDGEEGETAAAE
jgi:hypothetical protein